MPTTTRGPLPPGVYWRRRLALLSIALVLVLLIGKLLGGGSDGSGGGQAEQAGAMTSPTATVTLEPSDEPTKKPGKGKGNGGKGNGNKGDGQASGAVEPTPTPTPTTPPPLPDPTGPCADDDVFITATADGAIGGTDVTFLLNLQTRTEAACTWTVSPDTVGMTITRGKDTVWSSEQCPDALPTQDVTVRQASVTQVPMVWNSLRSDPDCTGRTAYALPGVYDVTTSALGGETTTVQFELLTPPAPTVTQTITPSPGDPQPAA